MLFLGGFNRNIVECKCTILMCVVQYRGGLIETLWNVNLANPTIFSVIQPCFNRNIVECK